MKVISIAVLSLLVIALSIALLCEFALFVRLKTDAAIQRRRQCELMIIRADLESVGSALLDRVCSLAPLTYLDSVYTRKDFDDLVKALEIWNGRRYA